MKQLLLFTFLCLVLPAKAQPRNTAQPPTFRLISASGSYRKLFYDTTVLDKPKALPLSFNQGLSPALPWPVDGKLIAYRLIPPPPDAPPETPPGRKTVFAVDLSTAGNHPIIVVFPNLKSVVIKDTPDKHIQGTVKVVNLSSYEAAIALGDDTNRLKAGESKILPFKVGRGLVQVAVNKGGWKNAVREERRLSSNLRGYIFITNYMEDPDYGPLPFPPPAFAKISFELSPDAIESP